MAPDVLLQLLDTLEDSVALLDGAGRIAQVNEPWRRFARANQGDPATLGVGADYLGVCDRADGDDAATAHGVAAQLRELLAGRLERFALVYPCHAPDEERWFELHAARLDGISDVRAVVRHRAVTPQVVSARLRRNQESLRRLTEAAFEAVVLHRGGRIIDVNSAAERLFAAKRERLLGGNVVELAAPESRDRVREAMAESREAPYEVTGQRADGTRFPAELQARTLYLDDERVRVVAIRDITEERNRALDLRRAERLAGLTTLIGGIAHELNNPLAAIKSFAQVMVAEERTLDDLEALQTILEQSERAAATVAKLRFLARETRRDAVRREGLDLNALVREVVDSGLPGASDDLELRMELADRALPVRANPDRMTQVITSLVTNACQALREHPGRRVLTLRTGARADRVHLEVHDTGPGIPDDRVDRIFDAFYTTRDPGEGLGLGLTLVQSILHEHGGRVRVSTEPGRGTAFVVELPMAPAP